MEKKQYSSEQSKPILIEDNTPKRKCRRIFHDAKFRVEVTDARQNGLSTKDLIEKCKSFNVDKTKISKLFKNKGEIANAALDLEKKLLKIRPGLKYLELHRELIKMFREAQGK